MLSFYEKSVCDYPPGYMYVLYLLEVIRRIFMLDTSSYAYNLLIKLPAIVADIACGFVIYNFAEKHTFKRPVFAAALFVFNPVTLLNSTWWGQADSVFTLVILISFIALYEKKYIKSLLLFATALLVKPQALIVFPVFLFYTVELVIHEKAKAVKKVSIAVICGCALFFAAIMPFSPGFNPLWIFNLYFKTLNSYPYATLNTPNIFGMLGANGTDINAKLLFLPYNTLSTVFIVLFTIYSAIIYFRNKIENKVFATSSFLVIAMYTMAAKMHERYAFPAIGLLILYYILSEKQFVLKTYIIYSVVIYAASAWVLSLDVAGKNPWIPAHSVNFILLSLICCVTFVYFCIKTVSKKPECLHTPWKPNGLEPVAKSVRYDKNDAFIILIMMVVYATVAFTNLGDFHIPQTAWENKKGMEAIIDLGNVEYVDTVNFYNGRLATLEKKVGTDELMNQYELMVSDDGIFYDVIERFATPSVLKWETKKINRKVRYIKFVAASDKENGMINEVAVYADKNTLLHIKSIISETGAELFQLYDEQELAAYCATYMNGTYFDEIYHARTAYEYTHGIEAYEWTHPPLGKLIISIGIWLFGFCPFGWRFMGTLFGIFMLPLMYILAKQLLKSKKYASLATFFMMFDFMHFTQTRISTIDTYAVVFVMLMYLFIYKFYETNYNRDGIKPALKYLFLSGLFFGLGAAEKWSCLYAGAGLAIIWAIYMYKRYAEYRAGFAKDYTKNTITIILWCMVYFIIIPLLIYACSYLPYAFTPDNRIERILQIQKNMYNYHSKLEAEHVFGSQWYSWPIIYRPIWFFSGGDTENGMLSSISSFGNPAVWWGATIAAIVMVMVMIKNKLKGNNSENKTPMLMLIGYLSQFLPWVFITRVVFIYHYFASVPFIIIIFSYMLMYFEKQFYDEKSRKRFNYAILAYCCLTVALFVMFYPVLSGLEVPKTYVRSCLTWFGSWFFGAN